MLCPVLRGGVFEPIAHFMGAEIAMERGICMESRPMSYDAFVPREMAVKAECAGVVKANIDTPQLFVLGVLAGIFIAMGANFATTVWAGLGKIVMSAGGDGTFTFTVPYGIQRLLGGIVFATGLVMVVVGGAELLTGNCLIPMAWASGKISAGAILRNWVVVYAGNFVGSVLTAYLVFLGSQHHFGGGAVGVTALNIAAAKNSLGSMQAIILGVFCNALVCMAIWMCFSARSTTDKILVIFPPIAAFVACGFEHCVANMYFIPSALFIKSLDPVYYESVAAGLQKGGDVLTWGDFLMANLIPVSIGNIIGGALVVAGSYWFVYLRSAKNR